jgi:ArsR family transcriptional regulator
MDQLRPLSRLKSEFFRVPAHPTRIRILEQLVRGERTVQDLRALLALEQPIVSQYLSVLRGRSVVSVRRQGTQAYSTRTSPLVAEVLRVLREFLNRQLSESRSMLRELQREGRRG